MKHVGTYSQIEELFNRYGLEKLIEEPKQVTGGLMHKMYQVTTKHNKYAVKEFNSSIMKRNGVIKHIINSERIAETLKETVSVISAIQFNDNALLMLNKKYYLIFDWLEGNSIFSPNISLENCMQIGKNLGKIHTADIVVPGVEKKINEAAIYEWDNYLLLGQETNAEWVCELIQIIDELKKWNEDTNEAYTSLCDNLILSHRDLDPKNVMWKDGNSYIIDWEAAGYINPYQELLEVLNYWADNGSGKLDKNKFKTLYNAYRDVVEECHTNWEIVIASGFGGMLGWLDYSFKRSLGIEVESIEEKKLGTKQVFGTIKSLRQYALQTTLLKDWLEDN